MISNKLRIATIMVATSLAAPAWAQTQSVPTTNTVKTTTAPASTITAKTGSTVTGNFQSLSPGNQKIARALFEAQQPTANGPAPLNLNQIAALKDGTGWGKAFKQMKSEGLVSEKNLGQVVSHFEHTTTLSTTSGKGSGKPVVMTTGSGRNMTVGGSGKPGAGDTAHDHDAANGHNEAGGNVTTASGSAVASAGGAHAGGDTSVAHISGSTHAH